jgi:hypothetical protein
MDFRIGHRLEDGRRSESYIIDDIKHLSKIKTQSCYFKYQLSQ